MAVLTFLGTGTSNGVPVIGCNCEVCNSDDIRDKRLRTSAYVITDTEERILIDIGPDFRIQALTNNITYLDGILLTHSHEDHIGGLDELRPLNFRMGRHITLYSYKQALKDVRMRFAYIFNPPSQRGGGLPLVNLKEIREEFFIGHQKIIPFKVKHGKWDIFGFRIGDLVYITDASQLTANAYEVIRQSPVNVLVINALRYRPHPTHFNLRQALEEIEKIKPKKAYLIHLTHKFKHEKTQKELPKGVFLAYDNLKIEFNS